MERPLRPLGVSLAVVASAFLFSILPLLQVALLLAVRGHFTSIEFAEDVPQPILTGGDILGISWESVVFQGVVAFVFLIIAIMAWRGKPSFMRLLIVGAVVALTAIKLITIVSQQLAAQNLAVGASSLDSILNSISTGQFVIEILVMLYVIWYMNRGPARAFYRGYYLSAPAEATNSSG
ncbi:MAG: hypothetical protein K8L97_22290 [Anaerolineae bacterium]|nr:hypothetical protein [Anaerolineae bacterium]